MANLPVTRAAHVIAFCEEFWRLGAPVQTQLERARLPALLEEQPDAYVSYIFATSFVGQTAAAEGIEDVSWLGANALRDGQLNASLRDAMFPAHTVSSRLKRFFVLSRIENSNLRVEMRAHGNRVQIISKMDISKNTPGRDAPNWTQVAFIIEAIRSIAGPDWAPATICFKTAFDVFHDALEACDNTRIITGAPTTAIYFSRQALSLRAQVASMPQAHDQPESVEMSDLDCLRSVLRPYFRGRPLAISEASEILGTSVRTLQRRLQEHGTSYSELVDTTRFSIAADLLTHSDRRLIEVAIAIGYEDLSNFARMFRKYAGMSLGEFRRAQAARA
ncbi:AraC-like DNA-binding protein [Aliiruegeria haliotis]|uniref:AraC-like DNA-binding protein n=1 Tax=Aliiruegeria haliotis TaxID=1280846 RepID=A0A2T0S0G9_9RHOB|nr:AraC family transcriptional regulator [Aliiruegeria haliotis]PRY26926.1 AraC-like DNA-binding protein [Aliiruegeria haliotis]